jgi:glycosyltransferase involved in cell wall biosynthesis
VIDARPALGPRGTGIPHYVRRIVRHLPAADPETEYRAWYLDVRGLFRGRQRFAALELPNLTEKASRIPSRVFQPVSWRLGVPRVEWLAGEFDLLLGTNFLPPRTGRPERAVPVVHDLAFLQLPESAPQFDAGWRRRLGRSIDAAPAVIVPSSSAREDLLSWRPVAPERVHVVHHGVDADAYAPVPQGAIDAVRRRFGLEGPYVLFVGGIEPRKNLERLVAAFGQLGTSASLVIAGGPVSWLPKALEQVEQAVASLPDGVQRRIVRTGYIAERDKVALLCGATVLAYPSRYEGFGFPVLEAFAAGVPVVTSTVSSLPEVAGDAAVLVDPEDTASIAAGLAELLGDEDLRAVLSAAGVARAARFTWERTAQRTAEVLHGAAEPEPAPGAEGPGAEGPG